MNKKILLASSVFIVTLLLLITTNNIKIVLNDYITTSVEGNNQQGKVKINFNENEFYKAIIQNANFSISSFNGNELISFKVEKNGKLKNGDIVSVKSNYNEEFYNSIGIKIIYKPINIKIKGLATTYISSDTLSKQEYQDIIKQATPKIKDIKFDKAYGDYKNHEIKLIYKDLKKNYYVVTIANFNYDSTQKLQHFDIGIPIKYTESQYNKLKIGDLDKINII